MTPIDKELSEAICRYLARNDQGFPKLDGDAVAMLVGEDRAQEVIAQIETILQAVLAAEWPLRGDATTRSEAAMRRLAAAHPGLSAEALEAAVPYFWHSFFW
ncbi:MAG TPA: hypothetical protein VD997_08885 [Phycisphaerales bacterium]|nr:hypothetical protein [Phycisphaerales bacterium]